MFDHFRLVMVCVFFFAMAGSAFGPLLGYQTVISQKQECYTHTEYDNRFEYFCAGVGLIVGLGFVLDEIRKKKKADKNDSEGN